VKAAQGTPFTSFCCTIRKEMGAGAFTSARRDPDWRFDQHKAGYKASRAVKRFGVCLLPELVEHLNPMMQWESLELEAALADAFRDSGIAWVEGGH